VHVKIPASHRARQARSVFEMFTQIDRSLERSQGGLGIGLTLVKATGGDTRRLGRSAQRGQGRGSEFVVRLPMLVEKSIAQTPTAEQTPMTARRILIVDDNRDAAACLAMLLKLPQ